MICVINRTPFSSFRTVLHLTDMIENVPGQRIYLSLFICIKISCFKPRKNIQSDSIRKRGCINRPF